MDALPSCSTSEAVPPPQDPKTSVPSPPKDKDTDKDKDEGKKRDFLNHLESYLAKRDGVDKLLKISRYASKIIIASSPSVLPFQVHSRLKSFESSVGLSRKAFRLGKFVQDVNALHTAASSSSSSNLLLSVLAYGGEGSYYFVEQLVWLTRSGLIDPKHSPILQKISAWTELVGYVGSISLKLMNLRNMYGDMEILMSEGAGRDEESKARLLRKLAEKRLLRTLSIVQDLADGLMAFADIRGGKSGPLSDPFLLSCAGLLSALISTHKNWISC